MPPQSVHLVIFLPIHHSQPIHLFFQDMNSPVHSLPAHPLLVNHCTQHPSPTNLAYLSTCLPVHPCTQLSTLTMSTASPVCLPTHRTCSAIHASSHPRAHHPPVYSVLSTQQSCRLLCMLWCCRPNEQHKAGPTTSQHSIGETKTKSE